MVSITRSTHLTTTPYGIYSRRYVELTPQSFSCTETIPLHNMGGGKALYIGLHKPFYLENSNECGEIRGINKKVIDKGNPWEINCAAKPRTCRAR